MLKKIVCSSLQDLELFINQNFELFKEKQFLLLSGDLGAGKTTFTKLLGKKIGIKEKITSPSFSYMKNYDGLIHIDLYNFKSSIDEFEDYFDDNLVVIEWANLQNLDFTHYVKINAYMNEDEKHVFEITEVK
ncbi:MULTISPECIES: tRNA (adenosine(37)-N6)-threonylcarbamoyltransferase complex ATPase subunit type 1 TsaE [unclassified Mycoplasma]|uniref:tRNA (adenosine(37)-N6)-threonylcarbamoyltransferase complex ATPase subunit type 1 TsaE n=1 Tax=unclassified Mycoplasma TaxID=2683645 RepID=UPI002B1DA217|nr:MULTISPECIES: tRNA (adenosine(37)-N6)-threonylcarbamoyltransferase complex ATPase subunit type 1 TsaE [unclassified Mycoplasma]MEA4134708.1 tRNA (adenosine(37)-N6)-threonylcarbamoyltransferase complex ATPase subunit type 1 TsaE [Mycoplasma sp. 2704]MEA4276598.1 tRNA (adenosine(37)-N6)-threonylcarbamoyltransferase complex ATPase subunit type 1 TsaE [Mycoplasma sp. 21DD0573]